MKKQRHPAKTPKLLLAFDVIKQLRTLDIDAVGANIAGGITGGQTDCGHQSKNDPTSCQ